VAVFVGSRTGRWQRNEIGFALDRQASEERFPVIPVLLDGADLSRSFLFLNSWIWIDPRGERLHDAEALEFLEEQTYRLNRSLGHLTTATAVLPEFRCPELYHRELGRYETSDATPLLWTQAALLLALHSMRESTRALSA
jgi:hypothetical protein